MNRLNAFALGIFGLIFAGGVAAAETDSVGNFYRGKTVTMTIGVATGGSYDLYGRLIARYMQRHVPGNPTIVPRNMPGAGGIAAAQRLANVAPRDGTEFGTFYRGAIIMPLLGLASGFDPREFAWIGSPASETAVCEDWYTSPVKTFEQARQQELIMGSTAKGADLTGFLPPLIKLAGAKFKIVNGYEGGEALDLAMARGEVEGRCGVSWGAIVTGHPDWLRDKKINILLQLGYKRRANLADVPMAQDFVKSAEDKNVLDLLLLPQQIAYPYLLPPSVPADRAQALRDAFKATMEDKEFVDEATKRGLELSPLSGEEINNLIQHVYDTPKDLIEKARNVLE